MANEIKTVSKFEESTLELVLNRVQKFKEDMGLHLPADYSAENALRSAWLVLQDQTDSNKQKVLTSCSKDSIANSLLDMVTQGLSVAKKQGAFIVYGNRLTFQREYAGSIALAKRYGGMNSVSAGVIYEGDVFEYEINTTTGKKKLVKHVQRFENINDAKIKGAYAIVSFTDGECDMDVMPIDQIRKSWDQGPTKGKSPAHQNFPAEMAKKTVINRVCKLIIASSDDRVLMENVETNRRVDEGKSGLAEDPLPIINIPEEPVQIAVEVPEEVPQSSTPEMKF